MTQLTEEQKARNLEWVEKLESGTVEQCRGLMRRGDCRCCLGVAEDIFLEHNPDEENYMPGSMIPGEVVAAWFGWDTENPILGDNAAAEYNDGFREYRPGKVKEYIVEPKTFPEIAKLIRKEFNLGEPRG